MRHRAQTCSTYEEFRQAFLDTYWSSQAQSRIRHEILSTSDFEPGRTNGLAKFFDEFYERNQYLDHPFTDEEIIEQCTLKFSLEIQDKLASANTQSVEQFRQALTKIDRVQETRKRRERLEKRALEGQDGQNGQRDYRGRWNHGRDNTPYTRKGQKANQGNWEQKGNNQWNNAPTQSNMQGPSNTNQFAGNTWGNQGGNGNWQEPRQQAQIVEIRPPNPAHNTTQAPTRN